MPGQPPPPRYRIYERKRRLVVIDQWTQGSGPIRSTVTFAGSAPAKPTPTKPKPVGKLDRIAFDGRTSFATHPLFDAKGPRTMILDPGTASTISGIKFVLTIAVIAIVVIGFLTPFLLIPLLVLSQRKIRDRIRTAATAWLDRVASA